MILVIDNYDSFTYNLVQYPGKVGASPVHPESVLTPSGRQILANFLRLAQ